MRNTCARHELIAVVRRATFRSTGSRYALGSVLLIGKSLEFLEDGGLI